MEIAGAGCRIVGHLILVAWLTSSAGCLATKVRWREPHYRPPLHTSAADADSHLLRAELAYAAALESEQQCSENCVDLYFQAAALTQCADTQCGADDLSACNSPAAQIYKSALAKLIVTGKQFGRLDARSGLVIMSHGQRQLIPVTHHGFVWDAEDFECLEPVGEYSTQAFRVAHRSCGCGVPLVVSSSCQRARPFLADKRVFAATAVLRAAPSADQLIESSGAGEGNGWALELYDPLRVDTIPSGAGNVVLAKDLSAPLAYRLRGERRNVLANFFTPQPSEIQSRLYTLEPYQPGKVPIVFIHGLLSDPFTWAEAVNELSAARGFVDHFQIWLFEYPTGEPFLFSAASMREQLAEAQRRLDPEGLNSQFSEMVLIGHSMGGLISKLQVTSSGDKLWRSIANRPIQQTVMQPTARKRLTEAFFFEPSPLVSRVIFIGTPHQGSADARRLAGRVASLLVVEPPQRRERHREIIADNPGVFSPEFTRRMPTSIDLLDPNSALLQALYKLPITECVEAHSIIGDSCWTIAYGRSDGVVPVTSARYPNVASERYIDTTHAKLNKDVEAIDELHRILKAHLQELRGEAALAGAQ